MRKSIIIAAVAAIGTMAFAATGANAAIEQKANVKITSTTGGKAKANDYVKLSAYLATRDSASTRPNKKPNPVANVVMTFPTGSTTNSNAKTACPMTSTSNVFNIFNKCNPQSTAAGHVDSVIGEGWALLSNLGSLPVSQYTDTIYGAMAACSTTVLDQYSKYYEAGKPGCLPRGNLYGKVFAYLGAMVNGVQKKDRVIFATTNKTTGVAFAGTVAGNVLTVPLPSGGAGKAPGELALGVVLTDFWLDITATNYLKAGSNSCVAGKATVSTKLTYSQLSGETAKPSSYLAAKTISSKSDCTS